jgi:transcriptional regulator GlxA family with amidase domain
LALFGAIPDPARVVRDGRYMSGGGVTAGIDFAFTLVAEIAGDDYAQGLQLALEYAPAPPFDSGRPELASPEVLARVQAIYAASRGEREGSAEEAARRLGSTVIPAEA